ncbi:MAG: sulfatase [Planctomycetota bacterium]
MNSISFARYPHTRQSAWLFAWLCFVLIGTCFASCGHAGEEGDRESHKEPPNVLFVFIDDMGWRDVGFMGSDFYETPHLDALAQQSLVFSNAYSCSANCAPARACLFSGQYTPRHKMYNVGTKPRGKSQFRRLEHIAGVDVLDRQNRTTWSELFQKAGYVTATMGKWHLSQDPKPYGFDINIGGSHSGSPPKGYYAPHPNAPGLGNAPADEYLTDRLSDEACSFIEKNKDRRWMLYLTHFAVHTPIQAKRELLKKYQDKRPGKLHDNAAMGTMVQAVDDGVGKIMETLKSNDLLDNTVIVFFSDNGGYGGGTDMAPLRGHKGTYYEGGIRVPFFIYWPGKIAAGRTDEPMIGVDLYPTLCEIAGLELPKNQVFDGVSLLPYATGKTKKVSSEPRSLFWHFPAYLQSTNRRDLYDEQRDPIFRTRPCSVIRKGNWKLIQFFESGDLELYDLNQDISESMNLAAKKPELVKTLFAELQQWQQDTGADIPVKLNPEFDAKQEKQKIQQLLGKKK